MGVRLQRASWLALALVAATCGTSAAQVVTPASPIRLARSPRVSLTQMAARLNLAATMPDGTPVAIGLQPAPVGEADLGPRSDAAAPATLTADPRAIVLATNSDAPAAKADTPATQPDAPLPQAAAHTPPQEPVPPVARSLPPPDPSDGLRSIGELSVDIRPEAGELPGDPASVTFAEAGEVHHGSGTSRPWPQSCFGWEAPGVCHQPLYFEQVNLERYGYSCGVAQPLVSAAHFFGTIPALPYLVAAEPWGQCVYTLGHYRPGSSAPFQLHRPPLSLRGAAAEAGVAAGLILAIP